MMSEPTHDCPPDEHCDACDADALLYLVEFLAIERQAPLVATAARQVMDRDRCFCGLHWSL
jgi:hypothetical protein